MVWKTAFLFFLFFYLNVVDAYLNQNSYVRFKYQTFMSNIKRENCCQVNVGAWQCPPNGQKTCMCVCVCVFVCVKVVYMFMNRSTCMNAVQWHTFSF